MPRWLTGFGIIVLLLMPAVASASDTLDVAAWLKSPGVKLLAVDFYADWCEPCKEAIPHWEKLLKKYRGNGLRVVIVTVQSEGRCLSLNWTPDDTVCDYDGTMAEAWRATSLPQGFLWNWRGDLLVAHGEVGPIENAVEEYFRREPRVVVSEPVGRGGAPVKDGDILRRQVQAELKRGSKFEVVAGADEMRRMLQVMKQAEQSAAYAEGGKCEVGQALPPNSKLDIVIARQRGADRLGLELYDLQKGCLVASEFVSVSGSDEQAAAEAVARLVFKVAGETRLPGSRGPRSGPVQRPAGPRVQGGEFEEDAGTSGGPRVQRGEITAATGRLIVKAQPEGAEVTVTGAEGFRRSARTEWDVADLKPGSYTITVEASGYESQQKQVTLEPDGLESEKIVLLRLGVLEVAGTPEKAKVEIAGPGINEVKGLPVTITDAPRGRYTVKVSKGGFEPEEFTANVEPGRTETVRVALRPPGTLVVDGEPKGAKVEVSGPNRFSDTGGLPMTIEGAWRGRYTVTVSREGYTNQEREAEVRPGQTARLDIRLERIREARPAPSPAQRSTSPSSGGMVSGATWRDPASGLTWQVTPAGGTMNWEAAKAHCSNLSLGGSSDWRLPDIKELRTLIRGCDGAGKCGNPSVSNQACSSCSSGGGPANGCYWPSGLQGQCSWYWSASSYEVSGRYAWNVYFDDGLVSNYYKGYDCAVRCAR